MKPVFEAVSTMIKILGLIQNKLIGKISKKTERTFRFFYNLNYLVQNFSLNFRNYLKPTAACQTKANARNNTGIAGITSTIGRNAK